MLLLVILCRFPTVAIISESGKENTEMKFYGVQRIFGKDRKERGSSKSRCPGVKEIRDLRNLEGN
jgi:hypothetical protein